MQWVECKCKNKCYLSLDLAERNKIYEHYSNIKTNEERKQYLVGRMVSTIPSQRTTKNDSRRKQTLLYYLNDASNKGIQVCPNVFLQTLQVC